MEDRVGKLSPQELEKILSTVPQEWKEIVTYYHSGHSAQVTATKYGITQDKLKKFLRAHGIQKKSGLPSTRRPFLSLSNDELRDIVEDYKRTGNADVTADKFNIPRWGLTQYLRTNRLMNSKRYSEDTFNYRKRS